LSLYCIESAIVFGFILNCCDAPGEILFSNHWSGLHTLSTMRTEVRTEPNPQVLGSVLCEGGSDPYLQVRGPSLSGPDLGVEPGSDLVPESLGNGKYGNGGNGRTTATRLQRIPHLCITLNIEKGSVLQA